jgi:hypothetical protein
MIAGYTLTLNLDMKNVFSIISYVNCGYNTLLSIIIHFILFNIKIIMFLGSEVWQLRKADNLAAICEPMV